MERVFEVTVCYYFFIVLLTKRQLKVVLDEMVTAQAEVNFKVNIYSPVYTEILRLMDKCDSSDVHRAKTKDLCKEWAHLGRCVLFY